jgi:amino acid adenylation domain-containing protein
MQNKLRIESEGRQSFRDWIDTYGSYPDACVHELFEQQVARDPDAVAVIFKERHLTYRELNQRANQVAHFLRKHGVGPEILVGVYLERSLEMIVGLLGILKAGGAYVPMDPVYPKERNGYILGDSKAPIVLTQKSLVHDLPEFTGRPVCMDSEWPQIAMEGHDNPAPKAQAQNLAYVFFTSGSTGRPKGVALEQRCAVSFIHWGKQLFTSRQLQSVLFSTSVCFDLSVFEIFVTLSAGGKVVIVPDVLHLPSLPVKNEITLINTVPSAISELLRMGGVPDSVKTINLAGEPLSDSLAAQIYASTKVEIVYNLYGPTETTTYSTYSLVPRGGAVTIGTPIANAQVYILDANRKPVPWGAVGELYIGGPGVARGYLNQPELTRERFLDDTFSGRSGSHLYKTGDMARYRKDGMLEFLGRVDDQVKIRGYRIELGEIEATLAVHPGVRSCLIVAREEAPGNKQLVAYLIAREHESVDAEKLKKFLRLSLPEYMVPAHFVFLESFPLNMNGKIDRKALPTLSFANTLATQEFVAPRTETEKKLAAIWMEVLNVDRIGIHDDLFDLGGNSLLAIKIMTRIRKVFGVALSLRTFCPSANIAVLAKALQDRENSYVKLAYAVDVQRDGKESPFCWIGTGWRPGYLSSQLGPNQPFFSIGFEAHIVEQLKAPYRMEEIAEHIVSALREKQPQGPYRLGGFCLGAVAAFEVARQLTMQGQDVAALVLFEPMNPLHGARVRFATGIRRMMTRLRLRTDEFRRLGISDFPDYFHSRLQGLKGVLKELIWEISARTHILNRQIHSPTLNKILFFAASSYVPKPLACPTAIFRCRDWPILSAGDPYFGWRGFLTGRSETHEIPGDHVGIFRQPNIEILAEKLRACLQTAGQAGTISYP